jgi:MFS transporter, ACS family, tartrate transporter
MVDLPRSEKTVTQTAGKDVAARARRTISLRLLPFLFLLYVVCYVDRANVSFANLRMSVDLHFSDSVYGLGVGLFFLGYVLFEIPGAIIVERWSARKWLARIMITWGFFTILNGFVHTARQFYAARLLVGVAEASFFPGVIVYLTHWFPAKDRAKAIAFFYAAVPAASVIGSLLAGWLLQMHWLGLPGWRWIFILEGILPLILGIFTIFYLTDWPHQARWLPKEEADWISAELKEETHAKKTIHDYTVWQSFRDRSVLLLTLAYFCAHVGAQGSTYFMPAFIRRLSGLPNSKVAFLVALPGLVGIAAMLLNSWHSDQTGERRWHASSALLCAGLAYALLPLALSNFPIAMALFIFGGGIMFAYYPVFWSMPTLVLSETAAAACFGLINSIGHTGGLVGPYLVGSLNDRTHSLVASFLLIAACYLLAGSIIPAVRIRNPVPATASLLSS